MSKRKYVAHERPFQDSWTNDYLFFEQLGKPLCLVCRQTVALSKAYNVKRHYESFYKEKYVKLNGTMREDLIIFRGIQEIGQNISDQFSLKSKIIHVFLTCVLRE